MNQGRLRLAQRISRERTGRRVPMFRETQFEDMIRRTRPDTVIVTSKDSAHDGYIIRAMEMGCDVITEKPMTTDAEKCNAILDAQRRTGKDLRVTFNYAIRRRARR